MLMSSPCFPPVQPCSAFHGPAAGRTEISAAQSGVEVVQDPELSKYNRPLRVAVEAFDLAPRLKSIDTLVNPTGHGGSASDAFHVVIPSMPSFRFSAIEAIAALPL
jgi:hypothetical protein